ncbi:MAG: DUF971 domain-containing protein [Gammaproteobacteria bacterium PRO9]|nr:DUF971 domain-containing protein [Gammaproteobacteria bacterium PRO9]
MPAEIRLDRSHTQLTVIYDDGRKFVMSSEYLRVHSPSAEVRGHVTITRIMPVGSYAVRLVFSDGHNTGLYTWKVLHELGSQQATLWQQYLDQVAALKRR